MCRIPDIGTIARAYVARDVLDLPDSCGRTASIMCIVMSMRADSDGRHEIAAIPESSELTRGSWVIHEYNFSADENAAEGSVTIVHYLRKELVYTYSP